MNSNIRSLGGAILMLAIIPIIAGLLACMPVPVGDPERSRIDPELNGVWRMTEGDSESGLYMLRPYDKRTWLVIGVEDDESNPESVEVYKAWLAKIGGERFMTWEQAGGFNEDGSFQSEFWYVFRMDKDDANRFILHMLNVEFDGFGEIVKPDDYEGDDYADDMRRTFERAIKRHIDNEEMYGDALVMSRLSPDQMADASQAFGKFVEFEFD